MSQAASADGHFSTRIVSDLMCSKHPGCTINGLLFQHNKRDGGESTFHMVGGRRPRCASARLRTPALLASAIVCTSLPPRHNLPCTIMFFAFHIFPPELCIETCVPVRLLHNPQGTGGYKFSKVVRRQTMDGRSGKRREERRGGKKH